MILLIINNIIFRDNFSNTTEISSYYKNTTGSNQNILKYHSLHMIACDGRIKTEYNACGGLSNSFTVCINMPRLHFTLRENSFSGSLYSHGALSSRSMSLRSRLVLFYFMQMEWYLRIF